MYLMYLRALKGVFILYLELLSVVARAGSVTPVSRYRDQFTSTPW